MTYKPYIDGLRALAVISVILFHAGFKFAHGGFVGVDVFFVISGFLITSIILNDLENHTFSIAEFYERRARRILPALFLVLTITAVFSWLWLLPRDLKDFSKSIKAISLFSSNILFANQSGYFETSSDLKPMLHTWSLAVEEQFYFFYPLLLIALWKISRNFLAPVLAGVCLTSLAFSQWLISESSADAFYHLSSRAWELGLGALPATLYFRKIYPPQGMGQPLSIAGLTLILASVAIYTEDTPFPGIYAVLPTFGTALLLWATTPGSWVSRVLGCKLLVGIGLISYSAYLWHQPIFALTRHYMLNQPSAWLMANLICLTFLTAYLSWKYVEQPFRKKHHFTRRQIMSFSITGLILFAVIGQLGIHSKGFPDRVPLTVSQLLTPESGKLDACSEGKSQVSTHTCIIGSSSASPTLALVGDSHSARLSKELDKLLKEKSISMAAYSRGWCAPLIDFGTDLQNRGPECRAYMNSAFEEIISDQKISTVILTAEWANYTKGTRYGLSSLAYYTDAQSIEKSLSENVETFRRALERTKTRLLATHKNVIIVASVP
jgi:peptidoglycan/LPS O-acetylase OafA/YrhL